MYVQKLYKNGNSVAVTIPKQLLKELNLRDGSEVVVEQDKYQTLIIKKKDSVQSQGEVTPHFLEWLDSFNKEYGPTLRELAKR